MLDCPQWGDSMLPREWKHSYPRHSSVSDFVELVMEEKHTDGNRGKVCMASLWGLRGLVPYLHIPDGSPSISGRCGCPPRLWSSSLVPPARWQLNRNSQILLQMETIPKTLHICSFSKEVSQNCLWLCANHTVIKLSWKNQPCSTWASFSQLIFSTSNGQSLINQKCKM